MNLFWKTVRETSSYFYQQHRITGSRRVVLKNFGTKSRPLHTKWLAGGEFNEFIKKQKVAQQ